MTDEVKFRVNTGDAQQSLRDLRKELNENRSAMLDAEEGSEEWTQALQKAADAQHRLNEVNRMVRSSAMDLGAVLQNSTRVMQGVVGGMNAIHAVTGMVSEDNEELAQTLLRVQQGMALVQGLQGIDGMIKGLQNLSVIMKGSAIGVKALTVAKAAWNAIMAINPIFLLITAIAAATAGIIALTRVLRRNNAEQKESNRLLDEAKTLREETQYLNDLDLRYLKAKGASEEEIYERKVKNLELEKASMSMEIMRLQAKSRLNKREKKELEELTGEYEKLGVALRDVHDDERIRRVAEETKRLREEEKEREKQEKEAERERERRHQEQLKRLEKEAVEREKIRQEQIDAERREEVAALKLALIREQTFENEMALLELEKERKLENEKLTESERLIIIEEFAKESKELRVKYEKFTLEEIQQLRMEQEAEMQRELQRQEEENAEQIFERTKMLAEQREVLSFEERMERMEEQFLMELELLEKHGFDTFLLRENYEQSITEMIADEEEKRRQQLEETLQHQIRIYNESVDRTRMAFNSIDSMVMDSYERRINAAEGNEEKQEKLRKKAFEANKKFEIANAVITGLYGIVNALSARSLIPEPFGMIAKIANATLIAGATAANIAKINSQRYQGGGGGGAASTTSIGATLPMMPQPPNIPSEIVPVRELQTQDEIDLQGRPMRAYVVETDITETSNRVNKIKSESEF